MCWALSYFHLSRVHTVITNSQSNQLQAAASLSREPGLADHSVEENFSQEEHQHQKDIGYFESNACSFGWDRNSGSSRRCLGRTEARFHFTAAKVLNWAVIVDNVHGAVHL